MALTFVSGTRQRLPIGNRYMVIGTVDEVTSAGDTVSAGELGLASIDNVVAVVEEAAVAVQAVRNSNDGSLGSSAGALYLKTASGTHDVPVQVIGR